MIKSTTEQKRRAEPFCFRRAGGLSKGKVLYNVSVIDMYSQSLHCPTLSAEYEILWPHVLGSSVVAAWLSWLPALLFIFLHTNRLIIGDEGWRASLVERRRLFTTRFKGRKRSWAINGIKVSEKKRGVSKMYDCTSEKHVQPKVESAGLKVGDIQLS